MPRIKIISIPEGLGIHEKIRQGWVGVEFEAEGPTEMKVFTGVRKVYEVPVGVALEALKKNNEMAWRWFFYTSIRTPVFLFPVESCLEISP